ncbi:MAG: hypothetical protein EHM41_00915 [Chloroflexi bacterium]|nr:MAG: hypothetical protein EHM41_00915 [Chloroflexota bacterium]
MPIVQRANPPEVPGLTDVQPERTGTDFGMDTIFKYTSNDHEVLKTVFLCVKLAPLDPGAGGNTARYPDDVLQQSIEWAEWQIGGTVLQRLWGDEMHAKQLRSLIPEDLATAYELQRAGLTDAERADLADPALNPDGFWVYLEIPFWWTETANKHWHQYSCQRATRLQIHWRSPDYILQQNVANTRPLPHGGALYIKDLFLRFMVSALSTDVKNSYVEAVKGFGSNGIMTLLTYEQRQENNIVLAGSTGTQIQMTNFNKPTYLVLIMIRREADLQPNYLRNRRFVYMPLSSYYSDASGHRLHAKLTDLFAKYAMNGQEFPGDPTVNLYYIFHSDYADVVQYPMGNMEYGRLQNPTLTIGWDAAIPENYQIDLYAKCYNYVRLVISSEGRSGVALEQPI